MSGGPLAVDWSRVKEWMPGCDIGEHIYALEALIYLMKQDDLRRQRDALAESLTQIRGRIVCAIRDERLPKSVRGLLVCLLHGQGIEDATQKGFVGQDHRPEHQEAAAGREADQAGCRHRIGQGGEEAAEEVTIHYDPATRWLREAGVTGPIDAVVMTWGTPVVFHDDQYETND